jgi:molecular chaperone GrpE
MAGQEEPLLDEAAVPPREVPGQEEEPVTGASSGPGAAAPEEAGGEDAGGAAAGTAQDGAPGREADLYERLLRLQAEFDNYRKRMERQRSDIVDQAATALVRKLLPVLDTIDLALAHGAGDDVKQVSGALFDVLSREGLERIVPDGEAFNPEHHDAVAHEPAEGDDAPERPEVSEVMRAGYSWKGRVLRPAMVKVRG